MSNINKSIHEFDVNLISEYFAGLERQGPGSPEATVKALRFINNLTPESMIADLGCGTGGQTMILARNAPGIITGIDIFPLFISLLNSNASRNNLSGRIKGIIGSMDNLPFREEELDLVWSEGAIYNIGFARGINEWRKFIKKGGYLAVTEASWLTDEQPQEIRNFWSDAYPEIGSIEAKSMQIQNAGYDLVTSFTLPEACWIDNFYVPQVKAQEEFMKKYPGNKTVEEFIANQRQEAKLYYEYKEHYGYVFYIARKN
ncbi:MAG TPA: class I SAM-dependent methyltransferase [Bacteroidales bacterium]|nr:class I SAM-dependent methyltransferase [Bacteroidales bacterium]